VLIEIAEETFVAKDARAEFQAPAPVLAYWSACLSIVPGCASIDGEAYLSVCYMVGAISSGIGELDKPGINVGKGLTLESKTTTQTIPPPRCNIRCVS
jgi:hypothetical protein